MLPYGKQSIDASDIQAVVDVLQSDWLTTGPMVDRFESEFSATVQSYDAVATSSGTSALHAAMNAIDIGPGDEVIVPAITFCATANAVMYEQATPVFADVLPDSLLIDPDDVAAKITPRTRAIVAVDYAGQPCDYRRLRALANEFDLTLVADACHSLGATQRDETGQAVPSGALADMSCFSFHPVKPITSGEGGMVAVKFSDPQTSATTAARLRKFRNHGIETDHRQRQSAGQFEYDMSELGFNYRMTDIQCALGLSQLQRLADFTSQRQATANHYRELFEENGPISPLAPPHDGTHAYHLFVVRCRRQLGVNRDQIFDSLRQAYIGANVHYRPVYQHSYYRDRFDVDSIRCPVADRAYQEILSLPIYPGITEFQVERVASTLNHLSQQQRAAA